MPALTGTETVAELIEIERSCISRFKQRAREIQVQSPQLAPSLCFSQAMASLPNSAEKYSAVRLRLTASGVPPLLFR
jgi:hypothetical protein